MFLIQITNVLIIFAGIRKFGPKFEVHQNLYSWHP